jgi:hypothetical protein
MAFSTESMGWVAMSSSSAFGTAAAALVTSLLAPVAVAQSPASAESSYSAPRTSFGHPSLEGVWIGNNVLPLEPPPGATSLTMPADTAKKVSDNFINFLANNPAFALDPELPVLLRETDGFPVVRGELRTRAVVEPPTGMLPYTPRARQESMSGLFRIPPANNPEERPSMERCLVGFTQAPAAGPGANNPRRIVQTPTHIVLHAEYSSDLRIIPLADLHKPEIFRSAHGDSIARWEGETLVIETIRLPAADRVRMFPPLVVSDQARVTERLTRIAENELLYQFTIEDPSVYTAPWLAEYSIYQTDKKMYESACHEGNYGLPNILRGQRVREERAAALAAAKPEAKR